MNESAGWSEPGDPAGEEVYEELAIDFWAQRFGVTRTELHEILVEYHVPVEEIEVALSR